MGYNIRRSWERGTSIIRLVYKNQEVQEACIVFMNRNVTRKEITEACYFVLALLYCEEIGGTLSGLRYQLPKPFSAITQTLLPEKLPPLEAAATHHCW